MTTSSEQEKFEAAVKIITGLPKDGPFQPSNDMKLKFYALYKQATLGVCTSSQPAFWDVINRAKWNAWKTLGDMPKDEAMRSYVEILKEVVETMTLDDNVQEFLDKVGPVYEFVNDDGRVVSKHANIDVFRPDPNAMEVLGLTDSSHQLMNGRKLPNDHRTSNGDSMPNGTADGSLHRRSPDESDVDDGLQMERNRTDRSAVAAHVVARKADLEAPSDEEEFDDASDNQAFASVRVDTAPFQSSGSRSPLSSESTPRHSSNVAKSSDGSPKGRENQAIDRAVVSMPVIEVSNPFGGLSSPHRRAVAAVGQLLRQLPDLEESKNAVSRDDDVVVCDDGLQLAQTRTSEDSIARAWSILRRIHAANVRQVQDDDDWLIRRLRRLKRGKGTQRKHRGHGGNDDGQGTTMNHPAEGGHRAGASSQPQNVGASGTASTSHQRQLSGGSASSSSSSGTDSANLDFDPHIGAVLLRMHRELQHINRQLELVEGILITQQHMIRSMATSNQQQEKKMRLGFFSNLPWRTIGFILTWPIIVNVLVRLWIYKMRRRR